MRRIALDDLSRSASKLPVTTAFCFATLVLSLLVLTDLLSINSFVLRSALSDLYPWCLVTYSFTVPYFTLLLIPLNVGLFVRWGAAVEGALGSAEYTIYVVFTVVVTAVAVIVVDKALLAPLGRLTGGLRLRSVEDQAAEGVYGDYIYWGVWPIAQVIVFALCRIRGVSAPLGPSWKYWRLTLQRLPLAIVACAAVLDVLEWGIWVNREYIVYRDEVYFSSDPYGWNCLVALISLFVAWLYERHASGTANTAFTLDAFFYPARLRAAVRHVGEATYAFLKPSRLRFLLPPRDAGTTLPMPLFASAAAASADGGGNVTLLPGTTAEEAERYRLIAREALARRVQEQRQAQSETVAVAVAAAGNAEAAAPSQPSPTADDAETEVDDKTA